MSADPDNVSWNLFLRRYFKKKMGRAESKKDEKKCVERTHQVPWLSGGQGLVLSLILCTFGKIYLTSSGSLIISSGWPWEEAAHRAQAVPATGMEDCETLKSRRESWEGWSWLVARVKVGAEVGRWRPAEGKVSNSGYSDSQAWSNVSCSYMSITQESSPESDQLLIKLPVAHGHIKLSASMQYTCHWS